MRGVAITLLCSLLFPGVTQAANLAPPPSLMDAIARQESDMNPLAVNVAGKDYYSANQGRGHTNHPAGPGGGQVI